MAPTPLDNFQGNRPLGGHAVMVALKGSRSSKVLVSAKVSTTVCIHSRCRRMEPTTKSCTIVCTFSSQAINYTAWVEASTGCSTRACIHSNWCLLAFPGHNFMMLHSVKTQQRSIWELLQVGMSSGESCRAVLTSRVVLVIGAFMVSSSHIQVADLHGRDKVMTFLAHVAHSHREWPIPGPSPLCAAQPLEIRLQWLPESFCQILPCTDSEVTVNKCDMAAVASQLTNSALKLAWLEEHTTHIRARTNRVS